eukprot:m.1040255 g.1040255  ORF g.1040255 m.1040255 type:complete len:69 (+) comp24154_c0_seq19:732-938(+)
MTWECRGDTMMDVLMVGLAQLHMNSVLWLTCSPSPPEHRRAHVRKRDRHRPHVLGNHVLSATPSNFLG